MGTWHSERLGETVPSAPASAVCTGLAGPGEAECGHDRETVTSILPRLGVSWRAGATQREIKPLLEHLDQLNRGVIVLDHAGRVRLKNARARELLLECFGRCDEDRCPLPLLLSVWTGHQLSLKDSHGPEQPRMTLTLEGEGRRIQFRLLMNSNFVVLLAEQSKSLPERASLRQLGLTRREAEVLAWVAEGKTNAAIAAILSMSRRTVQKHMEHLMAKLGAETRTAAARFALQHMRADDRSCRKRSTASARNSYRT